MPLSLLDPADDDLARGVVVGARLDDILLRGEQAVPGVLVEYSASSPGCFAFVPLEPLAAGERFDVRWTAPTALLGAEEAIGEVSFRPE